MANEKIKNNYKDIANAIRSKTGSTAPMSAEDMPSKISEDLAKKPEGTKSITANANNIDVSTFEKVDVNVPNPSTGTLSITENDTYDVTSYASVDVNVESGTVLDPDYIYATDDSGEVVTSVEMSNDYDSRVYWCWLNDVDDHAALSYDDLIDGSRYLYTVAGSAPRFEEIYDPALEGNTLYATDGSGNPGEYGAEIQYEGGVYYVNSSYSGPMPTMFSFDDEAVLQYNAYAEGPAILTVCGGIDSTPGIYYWDGSGCFFYESGDPLEEGCTYQYGGTANFTKVNNWGINNVYDSEGYELEEMPEDDTCFNWSAGSHQLEELATDKIYYGDGGRIVPSGIEQGDGWMYINTSECNPFNELYDYGVGGYDELVVINNGSHRMTDIGTFENEYGYQGMALLYWDGGSHIGAFTTLGPMDTGDEVTADLDISGDTYHFKITCTGVN